METFILFFKNLSSADQEEFASSCGTTVNYIKKIFSSHTSKNPNTKNLYFGAVLCRKFEERSKGFIKRQNLRPHDWRDHWPEISCATSSSKSDDYSNHRHV